jgi:hypothetical protein
LDVIPPVSPSLWLNLVSIGTSTAAELKIDALSQIARLIWNDPMPWNFSIPFALHNPSPDYRGFEKVRWPKINGRKNPASATISV